jgi:hypothetical protein
MENHQFSWENPPLMAIFNSYVKLPEGIKDQTYITNLAGKILANSRLEGTAALSRGNAILLISSY